MAAVVGAAVLWATSCGGSEPEVATTRPAVELIAPAVDAVESELGGPQEYFEINADDRLVNLFVAIDDGEAVVAYLYLDGELQPPAPPQPVVEGSTFRSEDLEFDPGTVLDRVVAELPGSELARFVVLVGPEGAVRHEVFVRSEQGGQLAVIVGPDGAVLGVDRL